MKVYHVLLVFFQLSLGVSWVSASENIEKIRPDSEGSYVRVCDVYGAGFLYIPGSAVCLKISGTAEYEITGGADVYSGERLKSLRHTATATLNAEARAQTELGDLITYVQIKDKVVGGVDSGMTLSDLTIQVGGLRVGNSASQFEVWLGAAGKVLSDNVIAYAGGQTNQINYTAHFGSGFSAMLGVEEGSKEEAHDYRSGNYVPHFVGGLKLEMPWGAIATAIGYDTVVDEVAAKVRLDLRLGDSVSAFVMGGYQSNPDKLNYFGAWNGAFAAWTGVSVVLSPTLTFNSQAAYEEAGKYAFALNLDYEVVPGLIITPELNYTSFGDDPSKPDHAFAGTVSIGANF